MWTRIIAVALGGATGSLLRYGVSGWAQRIGGQVFPVGTWTVNVVGCFFIGFLATSLSGPILIREDLRIALLVGLLGGFTTFSSYAWETLTLASAGSFRLAALNLLLNNVVGLVAAWTGWRLAVRLFGL